MMKNIEETLVDVAWPYWECEGEIARRYYQDATEDDHVFYLRAAMEGTPSGRRVL